jgi:hypothetical protein
MMVAVLSLLNNIAVQQLQYLHQPDYPLRWVMRLVCRDLDLIQMGLVVMVLKAEKSFKKTCVSGAPLS